MLLKKKINEELFLHTSYYDVSLANHGKTFHDLFIEPFCKKIFNMSSKDCPALLHRIAWAPLFYPETLIKGLEGKDDMNPTLFHYPAKGYFAAISEVLFSEIKANKNISIVTQKISHLVKDDKYEVLFENETSIRSNKLVWCNDLISLLQTAKAEMPAFAMEKASVTVAFCVTKPENIVRQFAALYVCEDGPLYRITNQEYSAKMKDPKSIKLVFEFNYDVLNAGGFDSDDKIRAYINSFLTENNILKTPLKPEEIVLKSLKNAVNMPTLNNFNNFEKLSNLTQKFLPDVELVGPAAGLVATSFNDQIVQAFKLGAKY